MARGVRKKRPKGKIKKRFIFLIAFSIVIFSFLATYIALSLKFNDKVKIKGFKGVKGGELKKEDIELNKGRLNILILGMEDTRTDMIMVGTYKPGEDRIDFISVPRDTYIDNNNSGSTYRKINSVYEHPSIKGGVERLAEKVSNTLGIPIDDYVMIDYDAVGALVEAVGGVDVEIPFNMYYDDPYAKPPLHIFFRKGITHLNGDNAIHFLRWRKNNDWSHSAEGDEGRMKRQRVFIKKFLEKAISPKRLPKVIDAAFDNVKTSLSLNKIIGLTDDVLKVDKDNINFFQAVGTPSYFTPSGCSYPLWYYIIDKDKTKALMQKIITDEDIEEIDLEPSADFVRENTRVPQRVVKEEEPKVRKDEAGNTIDKDGNIIDEHGNIIDPNDVIFDLEDDKEKGKEPKNYLKDMDKDKEKNKANKSEGENSLDSNNNENVDLNKNLEEHPLINPQEPKKEPVKEPVVNENKPSLEPANENPSGVDNGNISVSDENLDIF